MVKERSTESPSTTLIYFTTYSANECVVAYVRISHTTDEILTLTRHTGQNNYSYALTLTDLTLPTLTDVILQTLFP